MGVTKIDGPLLQAMIVAGANELNRNKQLVDSLNVFPVPDGDTGTNMSMTALAAAREAGDSSSLRVDEIAKKAAGGALRGARGNSGVITSQLFRGFAKGLEGLEEAGAKEIAAAARQAVKTAYQAVMKPKEGTILTIARALADAAEAAAEETEDIDVFLAQVIEEAHAVLLQTPDMLPVLKQAGVVDAGGKGLLCIIEGAYRREKVGIEPPAVEEMPKAPAMGAITPTEITFGYCTEFFVNVPNATEATLRDLQGYLEGIGDSIVCVHDESIIKIHVHTDHPGLALEKGLSIGSLSGLKIENMREQHTSLLHLEAASKTTKKTGFVSVSSGSGLSEIFRNLGADEIIEGGQTMNPSTEDFLNAIEKISAEHIILLPNNKNIILAAEQAAQLITEKKVVVIPSKTVPEGMAAMLHYDDTADFLETTEEMQQAVDSVITGSLTYAVRDTVIEDIQIAEGDILGMQGGRIVVTGKDREETVHQLLDTLITDAYDMISIYYGADVTKEEAEKLLAYAEEAFPDCDFELHFGNQPLYYYIISVE